MGMNVRLEGMTTATAAALLEGARPTDVELADDYPTEFSVGVAAQVANGSILGAYVIVEIGYAVVRSRWARGIATEAVRELLAILRRCDGVERVARTRHCRDPRARMSSKRLASPRSSARSRTATKVSRSA